MPNGDSDRFKRVAEAYGVLLRAGFSGGSEQKHGDGLPRRKPGAASRKTTQSISERKRIDAPRERRAADAQGKSNLGDTQLPIAPSSSRNGTPALGVPLPTTLG